MAGGRGKMKAYILCLCLRKSAQEKILAFVANLQSQTTLAYDLTTYSCCFQHNTFLVSLSFKNSVNIGSHYNYRHSFSRKYKYLIKTKLFSLCLNFSNSFQIYLCFEETTETREGFHGERKLPWLTMHKIYKHGINWKISGMHYSFCVAHHLKTFTVISK